MARRLCQSCETPLPLDARFCPACGTETPTEITHGGTATSAPAALLDVEASRQRLQGAVGDGLVVGDLIGRGGFAEVFRTREVNLNRDVAVKVIRPDLLPTPDLVARFKREARAIASLRNPNIMEIYSVGEKEGVTFFVMPYVEGESLASLLSRKQAIPQEETRRILAECTRALDAAHRKGIVHRDIKPDNILLEGEERRVLITDFGIAKALGGENTPVTASHVFVGTPQYLSPEQATGDAVDHRADIYSLGIVGYQMATGRLPFESDSVRGMIAKHITATPTPILESSPGFPQGLAGLIERCLEKDPKDRWQSARELLEALEGPGWIQSRFRPSGVAAPGEATASPEEFRRAALIGGFRRILVLSTAACGLALAAEYALTGTAVVSGLLVAAATFGVLIRFGRLWTEGYSWRDVLGLKGERGEAGRGRPALSQSGEHASLPEQEKVVRECRADRANILLVFQQMSRTEQSRFPELMSTVDGLLGRIQQLARQAAVLEDRRQALTSDSTGHGMAQTGAAELDAAKEGKSRELNGCVMALRNIRQVVTRSGGADSREIHDQLVTVLKEGKERLRSVGAGP